jgi:putative exosortase-associated protein (TIGR04073 family)
MAKRTVLIALLVFLLAIAFTVPGYCDDPVKKLGRGLSNIITCPFEIFLQASRVNKTDGPMAGATWGLLKGLGMTVARLGVGVFETVTFPVAGSNNYGPILKDPEFMFEEYNW